MRFKEQFKNAKSVSYWKENEENVVAQKTEPAPKEIHVDALVIGSGFTGTAAAYYLAKAGSSVAVLEQNPGEGASWNTGGIIVPGVALFPKDIVPEIGLEKAEQMYKASLKGISDLEDIIKAENLQCEFKMAGAAVAIVKKYHAPMVEKDMMLRSMFGDKTIKMDKKEFSDKCINSDSYSGGWIIERCGVINPAQFMLSLQEKIRQYSGKIYSGKATGFCNNGNKIIVEIAGKTGENAVISCDSLIMATNAFTNTSKGELGYLKNRVIPVQCYAIATEPLSKEQLKEMRWKNGMSITDSRLDFHYSRMTSDNRIIIGSHTTYHAQGAKPDEKTQRKMFEKIYSELIRVYPCLSGISVSHAWSGTIAMTKDFLPFYGKDDSANIYYAAGYNGHGLVLSTVFGKAVAELILGQDASNKEAEIFKRIPENNPKNTRNWFLSWSTPAETASNNYIAYLVYEKYTNASLKEELTKAGQPPL